MFTKYCDNNHAGRKSSEQDLTETDTSSSETGGGTRPSTPPPREDAFEQFKQERGKEINQILLQNKGECHV